MGPPSPAKRPWPRRSTAWSAVAIAAILTSMIFAETLFEPADYRLVHVTVAATRESEAAKRLLVQTHDGGQRQFAAAAAIGSGTAAAAGAVYGDGMTSSASLAAQHVAGGVERAVSATAAAARLQQRLEQRAATQQAALQQAQQQALRPELEQPSQQWAQQAAQAQLDPPSQQLAQQAQQAGDPEVFFKLVRGCIRRHSLDCLTQQKDVAPGPGQFRFPHFFIIGFQKCATTSLFHHLAEHPQIRAAKTKEPEFFTWKCRYNVFKCQLQDRTDYLELLKGEAAIREKFQVASFEGSTHYALEGRWLAPQLRDLFPWLRLIISMRDPISQAISMVNHNLSKNRTQNCYTAEGGHTPIFNCGMDYLDEESRYASSLAAWLHHFPLGQVKVLQYENLTSPDFMAPALREIKAFLDVDTSQPSDSLGLYNFRRQNQTEGWAMRRDEYRGLVAKARRNAEEVVKIVRQYGIADADAWMANWEVAWQTNLRDHCGPAEKDECRIQLT